MKLQRWLEKAEMTQTAFCKEFGMNRQHLSRILHGRRPGIALAKRIEEYTLGDVTAKELLFPPGS
jgi:transcriptional regulator with XRE-family HTH domain